MSDTTGNQPEQQPGQQPGHGDQPVPPPAAGYHPGYPPPPGYAPGYPPPYGWRPALPNHPQATTALVLGLVAIVGSSFSCGLTALAGPFAWVIGARTVREIDAQPGRWGGRDQARAGHVMGIISTVLLVIGLLFLAAYAVFFLSVVASGY